MDERGFRKGFPLIRPPSPQIAGGSLRRKRNSTDDDDVADDCGGGDCGGDLKTQVVP